MPVILRFEFTNLCTNVVIVYLHQTRKGSSDLHQVEDIKFEPIVGL